MAFVLIKQIVTGPSWPKTYAGGASPALRYRQA